MLPAVDIRYLDVKRVSVGGPRKPLLAAPVDRKKEAQGIGVISSYTYTELGSGPKFWPNFERDSGLQYITNFEKMLKIDMWWLIGSAQRLLGQRSQVRIPHLPQ